ncbi:MAG TPA: XRE family transcriptional regulator [Candidatus Hydrogenedentes bacterium]|nr:XRE family transcriptional regulator [Candidatus Hydrogenedentota bacterium]
MNMNTVSDTLKAAIENSGLSYQALGKACGVNRLAISRFVQGATSLRMDKVDMLCTFLGLELKPVSRVAGRNVKRNKA